MRPMVRVVSAGMAGALLAGCGGGGSTTKLSGASTPATVRAMGGGAFCREVATAVNDSVRQGTLTDPGSTGALRQQLQTTRQEEEAALANAPAAVKPDLSTIVAASNAFIDALSAAGYDFAKVSPSVIAGLSAPAVQRASVALDSYVKDHCGIELGSPGG